MASSKDYLDFISEQLSELGMCFIRRKKVNTGWISWNVLITGILPNLEQAVTSVIFISELVSKKVQCLRAMQGVETYTICQPYANRCRNELKLML